jgi:hypothetical protein
MKIFVIPTENDGNPNALLPESILKRVTQLISRIEFLTEKDSRATMICRFETCGEVGTQINALVLKTIHAEDPEIIVIGESDNEMNEVIRKIIAKEGLATVVVTVDMKRLQPFLSSLHHLYPSNVEDILPKDKVIVPFDVFSFNPKEKGSVEFLSKHNWTNAFTLSQDPEIQQELTKVGKKVHGAVLEGDKLLLKGLSGLANRINKYVEQRKKK